MLIIQQKSCQNVKWLIVKGEAENRGEEKCAIPHIFRAKSHT